MEVFLVMCGLHEIKRTVCRDTAIICRNRFMLANELNDDEVHISETTLQALGDREAKKLLLKRR